MNLSLVTWLTFASVSLLAVAAISWAHDGVLGYRRQVYQRVRSFVSGSASTGKGSLFLNRNDAVNRISFLARLKRIYDETDLRLSWERFCNILTATALLFAAASLVITTRWWSVPIGLAAGVAVCAGVVIHKHRTRMRKLLVQLPQALDVVGRAIQAGKTIPAAFQIVADDLESPIADEFRRCYEQQHLGISFESSLRTLAKRTPLMEMRIFIVALLVQAKSGGNLVDLIRDLSGVIQSRLKLEQRVRALTGEGRMQAAVLIVLPVAAFGLLYLLAPNYISVLLDRPSLIGAALAAQAIGAVWIRRCIRIEY